MAVDLLPVPVDFENFPPEMLVALTVCLDLDVALTLETPVESGIRIVEELKDDFVSVTGWSLIGSADEVMTAAFETEDATEDTAEDKHLEGRAPVKNVDTAVGPADSFAKSRSTTALA